MKNNVIRNNSHCQSLLILDTRFPSLQNTWYKSILLWFLTNIIGSTLWVVFGALTDFGVIPGLMCSLIALLLSLIAIPLAVPLMNITSQLSTHNQRRVSVFLAVFILFMTAVLLLSAVFSFNYSMLIMGFASPYLAAALLAAAIVYWPMLLAESDKQA